MPDRSNLKLVPRRAIPLLLILAGICGLVGCIYLPIPEHNATPNQKDFRPLIGTDRKPGPIHAGMSRTRVVALLGNAPYVSEDGRTMIYFLDRDAGYWFGVGCFTLLLSEPDIRYSATLVITFDDDLKVSNLRIDNVDGPASQIRRIRDFESIHDWFLKTSVPELKPGAASEPAARP